VPDFTIDRFSGVRSTSTADTLLPGQSRQSQNYRLTQQGPDGGRALLPGYGSTRIYTSALEGSDGAISLLACAPEDFNADEGAVLVLVDAVNDDRILGIHQHRDSAKVPFEPSDYSAAFAIFAHAIPGDGSSGALVWFDVANEEWQSIAGADEFPLDSDGDWNQPSYGGVLPIGVNDVLAITPLVEI